MKQEDDHIKRLFNEKLKGFEKQVPDSLWSRIDSSLSQNIQPVVVKNRQSKRRVLRWTTTAVSVAAMLALLLLLINVDKNQDAPLQQIVESRIDSENGDIQQVESQILSPDETIYAEDVLVRKSKNTNKSVVSSFHQVDELVPSLEENKDESYYNGERREDLEVVDNQQEDESIPVATQEEKARNIAKYEEELLRVAQENNSQDLSEDRKNGFSIGLNGRSNFALLNTIEKSRAEGLSYLPTLYSKKVEAEFRHSQPIALGLSVSKEIFPKVRVEAGVSYIYTSSEVKSTSDSEFEVDDKQVFHYLSVPITVGYRFAEVKKFKFQASVGGAIQKDFYGLVKGKIPSVKELENPLPDDKMEKKRELKQEKPQLSVSATLGVSYPLYKKLHVYTTVGWAYYFDAKNKYKTIYSDRPHQLDLNLGLRYDF